MNRLDDFKFEIILITTCTYIVYTSPLTRDYDAGHNFKIHIRITFMRDATMTLKNNSETTRCHDISVFHITASWYLNKRPIKILKLTKNNSDLVEVPKKGEKEQKSPF